MRQNFSVLMAVIALLFIAITGCENKGGNKGKATITLKNFKTIDSIYIKGKAFPSGGFIMLTTIADSIETIQKKFENKTPLTETFTYDVNPGDVANVTLVVGNEQIPYFLESGDVVEVEMNDKGFIQKSSFNGDTDHAALTYANKRLPDYQLENLKAYLKDTINFKQEVFDSTFKHSFLPLVKAKNAEIDKAFADKKVTEAMRYALQKNGEYLSRIHFYGNEKDFKWDDKSMGIANYRAMTDVMIFERKILDVFGEKGIQPEDLSNAFDKTLQDTAYPPKSKNMMLRALIREMGKFAPDLIKPSIAKIPDETIRNAYDKLYTQRYMLDMDQYRADATEINLVNIEREKGVTTFKQLLEKHKGKVVYVDFWASWCGPCRGEMPASHQLSEELKGQPVEFVYLSTDALYSDWAKAASEEGFTGNENSLLILNTSASTQFRSWKVDGIPRYMIFDKTGKLVNEDAPRPSDKGTKELLLNLAK